MLFFFLLEILKYTTPKNQFLMLTGQHCMLLATLKEELMEEELKTLGGKILLYSVVLSSLCLQLNVLRYDTSVVTAERKNSLLMGRDLQHNQD